MKEDVSHCGWGNLDVEEEEQKTLVGRSGCLRGMESSESKRSI